LFVVDGFFFVLADELVFGSCLFLVTTPSFLLEAEVGVEVEEEQQEVDEDSLVERDIDRVIRFSSMSDFSQNFILR